MFSEAVFEADGKRAHLTRHLGEAHWIWCRLFRNGTRHPPIRRLIALRVGPKKRGRHSVPAGNKRQELSVRDRTAHRGAERLGAK